MHHDVWDYDVTSQPSLASITLDGKRRDVVIQSTKQGLIFVLDRETGQPVLPVEERKTPQGGVGAKSCRLPSPFRPICRRWVTIGCGPRMLMV